MKKNKIRSVRLSTEHFELLKSYGLNVNEAFSIWIEKELTNRYECPTCHQKVRIKK